MFVETEISHPMLKRAVCRSVEMGKLRRSFMEGDRNIVGCTGEEVYHYHVPKAEFANTYDYDFLLREKRIDVKTRVVTHAPKPDYEMAILLTRPDQDVDFYVFCAVMNNFETGWLLGYLNKKEFLEKSVFKSQGSMMPQGGYYRSDSWTILMNQFYPMPN